MTLTDRVSRACFRWVHRRELVYNTCWEDPRIDRQALQLQANDDVLVITSAGCNALDYALAGPNRVYSVDVNPLQNALLELKIAGIRALDYEQFFDLFGLGRIREWERVYGQQLRPELTAPACSIWDRYGKLFAGRGRRASFYFRGSSGFFAWLVNVYINRLQMRRAVNELLECQSLDEQREVVERTRVNESLWRPVIEWVLRRDTTMSLLGVPRCQRQQIDRQYPGGIVQFIRDRIDAVLLGRPIRDNYFYRVYLTGQYTPECCPEYLKPDNFERLKRGLASRVSVHTETVLGFLRRFPGTISRYVLLDHMDWLYSHYPDVLAEEWQAIVDRAATHCRILWRSAGLSVDFVDPIPVFRGRESVALGEVLEYRTALAERLHQRDRVNTYGSFYIADLFAAERVSVKDESRCLQQPILSGAI
jgi:S-adenosylmethionine-diacylglycerol 3-amino-3-carboxypropyl transferase